MQISSPKIRIVDRYLLTRFLLPFGYCLAAFLLVILIYDFSINLEDFIDGKVRLDIVLEYFAYSIPGRIVEVIPMSSLLSTIYSLGQLKRHNEILALQASGVSQLRLMAPFLCFGLFSSAVVLGINETLVPHCLQRVAKIESAYMKKGDGARDGVSNSVFAFYNLQQGRSWVGVIDTSKKTLLRVEIREFGDKDKVLKKITAEQAQWTTSGWQLTDGKITEYGEALSTEERVRPFLQKVFPFSETLRDLMNSQKDPHLMSLRELKTHLKIHPKHSRVFHEEKVEYYQKWAYPLLNFLVMLMGVPIGLRTEKGSFFVGVGTSLGIFLAYYGVNLISLTLGKSEMIAAWLGGWLPTVFFGIIGISLAIKKPN